MEKLRSFFWPGLALFALILCADTCNILLHKPVQYYAGTGNVAKVQEFLDRGWDVNKPMDDNYTLLMVAACNKQTDMIRFLLSKKADTNLYPTGGFTALHTTVEKSDVASAEVLLHAGANPNFVSPCCRYSPFDTAVIGKRDEMITLLLKFGGKRSLSAD